MATNTTTGASGTGAATGAGGTAGPGGAGGTGISGAPGAGGTGTTGSTGTSTAGGTGGAGISGATGAGGTGTTGTAGTSTTGGAGAGDVRETHNLIASDKVEGTPVRRSSGEKIGTIERVMIEKRSGQVAYAVMSFGGFMGLGEDYYTLPWSVLKYNTELDAYELNLTEDQLRGAPRRSAEGRDASFDRQWEEHVHRYYNASPYWGV